MNVVRKVLHVLTMVSAGLAALVVPLSLFAVQGMNRFGVEAVVFMLSLLVIQPASLVLIFLVGARKIPAGRPQCAVRAFVAFNALFLFAVAALLAMGVFPGDVSLPIILAVPSLLFLVTESVRAGPPTP